MNSSPAPRRHTIFILCAVALAFLISSNIAWLNPRPTMNVDGMLKLSESIPFMWQYNHDSQLELGSAAFFPDFFFKRPARISRPLYPMAVKLIGTAVGAIVNPLIAPRLPDGHQGYSRQELIEVADAVIGYILLKLIVFSVGSLLLYRLLLRYLDPSAALLAVLMLVFHPFSIRVIATYHTSELQFFVPIAVVYMLHKLGDRYSMKRVVSYSLIVGVLLLGKQNYAAYLAVLVLGFFSLRKRRAVVVSLAAHLVPLALWMVFLRLYGLSYYDVNAEDYGSGVWLTDDLLRRNPVAIAHAISNSMGVVFVMFCRYYSVLLLLASAMLFHPRMRDLLRGPRTTYLLCLAALVWLQSFAGRFYRPDLTSDLAFAVFGLSAFAVMTFFSLRGMARWRYLFVAVYFTISILSLVQLPWVPPQEQGVAGPTEGAVPDPLSR